MKSSFDPSVPSTIFTAHGSFSASNNIQNGAESLPEIARRFAKSVYEGDITFFLAIQDLNEVITLMGERGGFINPQREGLTRNNLLKTFWNILITSTGGAKPVEASGQTGKYNFEDAVSLLGESIIPYPESAARIFKTGYIVDLHLEEFGGWTVDIVDETYGNRYTISKLELETNFRSAKILNKQIQTEEILQLFTQEK